MIKFVKREGDRLVSAGDRGSLDYSIPGTRIEVAAAPQRDGQCAAGIHALHLPKPGGEPYNPYNVVFGDLTAVLLDDCDVVYDEPSGKCRLRSATIGETLRLGSPVYEALLLGSGSPQWQENVADAAARAGQLEVLKWLAEQGVTILEAACNEAARAGQWEVLKWLAAQGVTIPEAACNAAAWAGQWEVLKWLKGTIKRGP